MGSKYRPSSSTKLQKYIGNVIGMSTPYWDKSIGICWNFSQKYRYNIGLFFAAQWGLIGSYIEKICLYESNIIGNYRKYRNQ